MARRWRALSGAFVVLAAACLAACGAGAGSPSSDASLLVTADFGSRVLVRDDAPEVRGADTVMRLVQRNAKVTTRYGGGFVQSIDGVAGGQRGGRPVDWFFYVDGVLSDRGAASVRVGDGDAVWWDHHDWGSGPGSGSAVVGSFPAPFTSEAVLACIPASAPACATTRQALTRAGARVRSVAPSALGRGDVPGVLVGTAARDRRHAGRPPAAPGPGGQRRLRTPGPRRAATSRCSTRAATASAPPGPAPGSSPRRARRAGPRSGPSPAPTTRACRPPRAR